MPFGDRTGGAVCPGAAAPGTAPLCREMLGLETKAAAFPELSLMQQWWHRWLGCGISMGVAGWDALWQAADDALQILPESLTAACCAEILGKF